MSDCLCSALFLVPDVLDPDGEEILSGELDCVSRADVESWAARIMAGRTGGRVFVMEWEPGPFGDRVPTGVTGERFPDDVAVRWFGESCVAESGDVRNVVPDSLMWHEVRGYWVDDRRVVWSGWFSLSSDGRSVVRRKIRGRNRCHWGRVESGVFYADPLAVPGLCRWGVAE